MGLFRLLFWILVIIALVWLWRRLTRPAPRPGDTPRSETEAPKPMVRCAHCGVHLPREEALADGSLWYCSRAHLAQGPRSGER